MKPKWDTIITAILVGCAVMTTFVVIRREFAPGMTADARPEKKPIFVEDWLAYGAKGIRQGPENAPVQLIEFADFECPFCSNFHRELSVVRKRYPDQIALTYIHFPLPMHRFAVPAARAAECAYDQGRFERMQDLLFDQQNTFGLKTWSEFATDAGVPDLAAFEACTKNPRAVPRIEDGRALGSLLNIAGTPTLLINGWHLPKPPTTDELDRMIKRILSGQSPLSDEPSRAEQS